MTVDGRWRYSSPPWLPGGHAQTIWPALFSHRGSVIYAWHRERLGTPDGDFVDVDWSSGQSAQTPLLVLFHGLEGSSASHYAQAFAHEARNRHLRFAVPHFRGCSGEINLAPRAYHSGDFAEVDWVLASLAQRHEGPLLVVGVSLGGNALLRWTQELGRRYRHRVSAVAAISAPLDLRSCGLAIGRGFGRQVYTRMFLRTMKRKALLKLQQYPGLFDRRAVLAARDLYAFDDVFTAPLHGFRGVDDYWERASALPGMRRIGLPALVVNALNDPFVPASCLPSPSEVSPCVALWQPRHGGHVGFVSGRPPGHVLSLPETVIDWLLPHAFEGLHHG